jgi:hypothetical protein
LQKQKAQHRVKCFLLLYVMNERQKTADFALLDKTATSPRHSALMNRYSQPQVGNLC